MDTSRWRTKKRRGSPPAAPSRPSKYATRRRVGAGRPRGYAVLEDPDEWLVQTADTPAKLTCVVPPTPSTAAAASATPIVLKPTAMKPPPADPWQLVREYPPQSVHVADADEWLRDDDMADDAGVFHGVGK